MATSFRRSGHAVVSGLLGLLLIGAAVLKAHQQASGWPPASGLLADSYLALGTVAFELALGIWLLAGSYPRLARWFAATSFSVFLAVSLAKAGAGEATCGCFGSVSVNPRITAALDALAVAALFLVEPQDGSGQSAHLRLRLRGTFAAAGVLMLSAGGWWTLGTGAARLEDTRVVAAGSSIVIDPQGWMGQRFPLLPYINIGNRLDRGEWCVVLYRHDCPACHEQLPAFTEAFGRLGPRTRQLALVEVPTERPPPQPPNLPALAETWSGRLRDGPRWLVQTPLFLRADDGIVRGFAHNAEDSLQDLREARGGF